MAEQRAIDARVRRHADRMEELMKQGLTREAASKQAYNEIMEEKS